MLAKSPRLVALAAVTLLFSSFAHAASQRAFVSAGGVDNPNCSLAAPCRSFATAIAAIVSGGEVIALDSAGYGPVTITQAASIIAPAGVYAGISVFSGDGITINAGINDIVKLRGLTINGLGGVNGIAVNTVGLLEVENISVSGFSFRGLNFAAINGRLTVTTSAFDNNGESGLLAQMASGAATVTIDHSRFDHNGANGAVIATSVVGTILNSVASHNASVGFLIDEGGIATVTDCKVSSTYGGLPPYGIFVRGVGTKAMIARCDVLGASQGYTVYAGAHAQVSDSSAQSNDVGFLAYGPGSVMVAERSAATNTSGSGFASELSGKLSMSNCTSTFNGNGAFTNFSGILETRQNNTFRDNGMDVSGGSFAPFGPL